MNAPLTGAMLLGLPENGDANRAPCQPSPEISPGQQLLLESAFQNSWQIETVRRWMPPSQLAREVKRRVARPRCGSHRRVRPTHRRSPPSVGGAGLAAWFQRERGDEPSAEDGAHGRHGMM